MSDALHAGSSYDFGPGWCARIHDITTFREYRSRRIKEIDPCAGLLHGRPFIVQPDTIEWRIRNEWTGNVDYPMRKMVWC